ncbi:MAG: DUF58 domain-containing protein, partial [Sedimentisphaerales bacterium]|nr:DUF58 domain-containing protein [Sedimentisphaerales bacterium]
LAAGRNVPRGIIGSRMGSRAGSSLEFMDHREYQPGDDLRRINWSAYARSDKLTVKLFREEVNPHLDIIIDGSASMALENTAKPRAALGMAALFAVAAANADYTHAAWLAGKMCREVDGSAHRPDNWNGIDFTFTGDPGESFTQRIGAWRPRGIRVFISDLLLMGDPQLVMSCLSQNACSVIVLQILAQEDVEPPRRGNIRLVDCETRQVLDVFIDATVQRRYQQRLQQHQDNWHRCCRQKGALMTTLVAEELISSWEVSPGELISSEILEVC